MIPSIATSPSGVDAFTYYEEMQEVVASQISSSSAPGAGKSFIPFPKKATNPSIPAQWYAIVLDDHQQLLIELPTQDTKKTEQTASKVAEQSITFIECLNPIRERLSLSITQLAELFAVTRKSIYDWYDGVEPRSSVTNRLEILIEALKRIPDDVDLKRLKVVWNIPIGGKSFLSVYNNVNLENASLLTELTTKLHELSPRLVKKTGSRVKTTTQLGESHLAEFDRRADFS